MIPNPYIIGRNFRKGDKVLNQVWRVTIAIGLLCLCSSQAEAQKWGKVSDEEWVMQPPADYPEANAIILFDRGLLEVSLDGIAFTRHVRMKVFNQAGIEEVADVTFNYYDDDKIKILKAHCITPDGKKHKVGKKKFYTKTVGNRKSKTFSFPGVESGSILEYQYKNVNKRYSFLEPWSFQNDSYTMRSTFSLLLHGGFTYFPVARNIPANLQEPELVEDRVNSERKFTWSMQNLNPIKAEPHMGNAQDYVSSLDYQLVSYKDAYNNYTFVKDWPTLGQTFSDRWLKEYLYNTSMLDATAEEIMAAAAGLSARSRAVYDHVCSAYKTKADERGYYLTHESIGDLVKEGFGTADEKNLLLVELARKVGLEAWPVLIGTRGYSRFSPEIFQVQQFNHLLAYVETDSGGVFLDATTRFCPYGMLPPHCVVEGGFLIDGRQSEIIRIPVQSPQSYRMDVSSVEIDTGGDARCSTTTHLSGYYTAEFGTLYERKDPEEFFQEMYLDKLDYPYELLDFTFEKESDHPRCVLTMNYRLDDFAQSLDDNLLFAPVMFSFRSNPFESERRIFPVDFDYPLTYHNIVNVNSFDGLVGIQLPEDLSLSIPGIQFVRQCINTDPGVRIETILKITKPVLDPHQYDQLRELFKQIAEVNAEQFILSPKK